MIHLILVALAAGPVAGSSPPQVPVAGHFLDLADSFQELSEQYESAVKQWRSDLRATEDAKEKRELRKLHPAREFYPRFAALLEGGELQAALWMIENLRQSGRSRAESQKAMGELYVRILTGDLSDFELLERTAERLVKDRKKLEPEYSTQLLSQAFERAEVPETKALLGYSLGRLYGRLGGEENQARSSAWMERMEKEFADTVYGARASEQLFEQRHLSVGVAAPDFTGQSIDGDEIKLSEQRGKIVVVDFFGFW